MLFESRFSNDHSLDVFLVDDGSTDSTTELVSACYPQVTIIKGDGSLFWNGGMRVAFDTALAKGYDYYLWLNDDTLLYPTSLQNLYEQSNKLRTQQGRDVIVVGATQDGLTGNISYGGVTRPSKWKPTSFKLMPVSAVAVECETMNGNCVLIPAPIANVIGGMEPGFAHAMGDLDYGLRARAAGFSVWVAPGFAGSCSNNSPIGSFNDAALPLPVRLRKMLQPKGLPIRSWRVFTQRHAGVFWPFYWLWPYVNLVFKGMLGK
jgi:GT2 family glycosyltransferase